MKNALKKIIVGIITWEARLILRRYKPHIVAITGNMGKTSTKDAVYSAFSGVQFVRKSEKSLNSEIGVPLTILGCESGWNNLFAWISIIFEGLALIFLRNHYPRWLILEVGADRPGDISRIAKWLKPDIAIITGVPDLPVHIEFFSSPEEVAMEKEALARALKSEGVLILNGDDERTLAMKNDFRGVAVTYGFGPNLDFTASHEEVVYKSGAPAGMRFRVNHAGSSVPVNISGAIGRTHIYPSLAAFAAGVFAGLDMVSMARGISEHKPPPGRMNILKGIKGTTIIDDTYNASPVATMSALDTIGNVKVAGRKVVVIGDMLELGRHAGDAHKKVGEQAAEVANILVTVGIRARGIAEAAMSAGMDSKNVFQYEHHESRRAGKELEQLITEGDIILVKGSQSMRMERAVKEIMAEPERAKELLVRQELEWLSRE